MSVLDDLCANYYRKDSRMLWARKFIGAWLVDPQLQFIANRSLDSLTSIANDWIRKTIDFKQVCPSISSEDVREAAFEALDSEEVSLQQSSKAIVRLDAIVRGLKV